MPTTSSERILNALTRRREPLTWIEISSVAGVKKSSVSNVLDRLVDDGLLHKRSETAEERLARLGQPTKGAAANLYSVTAPVPVRVTPAIVKGSMHPHKAKTKKEKTVKVKTRNANAVQDFINASFHAGERESFVAGVRDAITNSYQSVADITLRSGLTDTTVRKVLDVLVEAGEIEFDNGGNRKARRYRKVFPSPAVQALITPSESEQVAAEVVAEQVVVVPEVPANEDVTAALRVVADALFRVNEDGDVAALKARVELLERDNKELDEMLRDKQLKVRELQQKLDRILAATQG